jgi:hypothetical protein
MSRFRIVNADRRRPTHDQPKTGGAINYSTGEENLFPNPYEGYAALVPF